MDSNLKYEMALNVLDNDVKTLLKEYVHENAYNPVNHIEYRIKTRESCIDKLIRKGYEPTMENVQLYIKDVVGYRIICNFLSEVEEIVKIIETSKQIKIISRKDYITHPKNSGYISYHLIVDVPIYLSTGIEYVKAEIQIRTLAMNFWAALDHKIQYKFTTEEIPKEVADEMYNISLNVRELDNKMLLLNDMVNKYKK